MENEMRLIDANEAIKQQWYGNTNSIILRQYAVEVLKNAPTVSLDAVPVVHGCWVVDDADSGEFGGYPAFIEFHCPFCKEQYSLKNGQYDWTYGDDIPFKFCHECGAKMDLKEG